MFDRCVNGVDGCRVKIYRTLVCVQTDYRKKKKKRRHRERDKDGFIEMGSHQPGAAKPSVLEALRLTGLRKGHECFRSKFVT